MTANAGKGANGKDGRTRKKTSAAKPPSDEVTVRTDSTDDTKAAAQADDADDTVIDVPAKKDDDTARDASPADGDDETTRVDVVPPAEASDESPSSRTAAFGLPGARGDSASSNEDPQESEALPSSGRGAAMDSSTPPSGGFGGGRPISSGTPSSYAPSGGPARPRVALEAAARVSKLAGALRKPERAGNGRKAPRKAHLQVARFEPWSVMKFSFIMSLVCFLVLFVAVAVLYVILSWLGVFDALSNTIHDLTSNDQGKGGGLNPASWFSAARILGYTALIGTLNVLLITALATVWSVIYNMAADLVGGVEVTLKEADQ
jgi:Transmembrane domain of unknown function (DUF3566)